MSIPGLSTLKTWILIALSLLLAGVTAAFGFEKAARANEKLKGEIDARKRGQDVNEEIMKGVNREQVEVDKARNADSSDRHGFE